VLEGWCLGARPQAEAALAEPVNTLERDEDGQGRWRRAVNAARAGEYQRLFARIDRLVYLAAPDFAVVARWREEQEAALQARADAPAAMDSAAVARFVLHYERITRHMLAEMPARADLLVKLDAGRRPVAITP
jgi:D-glycerate 3-kinase